MSVVPFVRIYLCNTFFIFFTIVAQIRITITLLISIAINTQLIWRTTDDVVVFAWFSGTVYCLTESKQVGRKVESIVEHVLIP